jgi:hypothetical protein
MKSRPLLLALCVGLVSCGKSTSDSDDGVNYRTTFGYFLTTPDSSVSSVIMSIMSEDDLKLFQTQTATTQSAGLGFIAGRVMDGAGSPISGVTVEAHNDSGLAAGSLYYQSGTTLQFTPILTQTSSTGRFIVMNVSQGRVNLKCSGAADGNLYVRSVGNATVFCQLNATTPAASPQPTWSGVTQNLGGTGTALPSGPEPSVVHAALGTSGLAGTSDGTTGAFSYGTVHALSTYIVRCTKASFVDTYTYVSVGTTNLTSGGGGGNLLIASVTNRDNELVPAGLTLAAGTGMIRGRVMSSSGGFTVEARNSNDAAVGDVRYGGNGDFGRPNDSLTSTETDGFFYIYNLPPGQYLLRATKTGFATSTYVDVFADGITLPLDLNPVAQGQASITLSGALATLQGFAVPKGNITLHGLGLGANTDNFGEYNMTGVPTRHLFIVRTSK